jgi:peroxisomal 2,4-dienoyl-CoA reductase
MVSDFRADLMAGKVLVITGGATGIGIGICQGFGRHGAKVVLCGRRQDALDEACGKLRGEGIECLGVTCDVRDAARCEFVIAEALRAFGKVDFLVNNAAGNFSTTIENLSTNARLTSASRCRSSCCRRSARRGPLWGAACASRRPRC